MTSASLIARRAAARIATCNRYWGSSSPGESVKMNWVSPVVSSPTTGRRVDCGLGETMARCSPFRALSSADLPTLGRPASTTVPQRGMSRNYHGKRETGNVVSDGAAFPVSRFPFPEKSKPAPANRSGLRCEGWRRPTLPPPRRGSTIGADRLNDRVRDGNGCGPVALVASQRDDAWVGDAEAHLEREEIKPHGQLVRLGSSAHAPC